MHKSTWLQLFFLFFLVVAINTTAQAQDNDFIEGRIFQVALEFAPGFIATGEPTFGTLGQGENISLNQTLPAGTCTFWIAAGDTAQSDIDISVWAGDSRVAHDNANDDWPVVHYCSAPEQEVRVDLLMYGGSGNFGLRTFSHAFSGTDEIEVEMSFLASVYAVGMEPQGTISRHTLGDGESETLTFSLQGGACYSMIGASASEIGNLDFYLFDSEGRIIDADTAPDNYPIVGVCVEVDDSFFLRTAVYDGAGEFGWRIFRESVPY